MRIWKIFAACKQFQAKEKERVCLYFKRNSIRMKTCSLYVMSIWVYFPKQIRSGNMLLCAFKQSDCHFYCRYVRFSQCVCACELFEDVNFAFCHIFPKAPDAIRREHRFAQYLNWRYSLFLSFSELPKFQRYLPNDKAHMWHILHVFMVFAS